MRFDKQLFTSLVVLLTACGGGGGGEPSPSQQTRQITITSLYNSDCVYRAINTEAQLVVHDRQGEVTQILNADENGLFTLETNQQTLTYTLISRKLSGLSGDTLKLYTFEDYPASDHTVYSYLDGGEGCACENGEVLLDISADLQLAEEVEIDYTGYDQESITVIDPYRLQVSHPVCSVNESTPITIRAKAKLEDQSGYLFSKVEAQPDESGVIAIKLSRAATSEHFVRATSERYRLYNGNDETIYEDSGRVSIFSPDALAPDESFYHYCFGMGEWTAYDSIVVPVLTGFSELINDDDCLTNQHSSHEAYLTSIDDTQIAYQFDSALEPDVRMAYMRYQLSDDQPVRVIDWTLSGPGNTGAIPLLSMPPEIEALAEHVEAIQTDLYFEDFAGIQGFRAVAENILMDDENTFGNSLLKLNVGNQRRAVYFFDFLVADSSMLASGITQASKARSPRKQDDMDYASRIISR